MFIYMLLGGEKMADRCNWKFLLWAWRNNVVLRHHVWHNFPWLPFRESILIQDCLLTVQTECPQRLQSMESRAPPQTSGTASQSMPLGVTGVHEILVKYRCCVYCKLLHVLFKNCLITKKCYDHFFYDRKVTCTHLVSQRRADADWFLGAVTGMCEVIFKRAVWRLVAKTLCPVTWVMGAFAAVTLMGLQQLLKVDWAH